MKNKWVFLFVIVMVLISCDSSKEAIMGKYETDKYSKIELGFKWFIQNTSCAHGFSLELQEDSSFFYQTCGNQMTGNWIVRKDSLFLILKTSMMRFDQSMYYFTDSTEVISFQINENELIHKSDGSGAYSINTEGDTMQVSFDYTYFRLKKLKD